MRVALVTHPSSLAHDTGYGHPERAARTGAVVAGVRSSGLDVVDVEAKPVSPPLLETVHDPRYIRAIEEFCRSGGGALDPDTVACPESWEAALHAAGGAITAAEVLLADTADTAFSAMRPPGHHAMAARAMGFCLFNNVAVLARWIEARGERAAIVDWDVHHGNGTQATFYGDPDVLYLSFHEHPQYPGTGLPSETGAGAGEGTTVNFAWPRGTGGPAYRLAFDAVVDPILTRFSPEWILVSSGYDAHRADPLAGLRLEAPDYGWMAARLRTAAPDARVVFVLEGGYDLAALTASTTATLRGAAGDAAEPPPAAPGPVAEAVVAEVRSRLAGRWDLG